jgi:TPP-dependent pyruvate/acetoin dehydrogenase alpha subunit
MFNNKALYRSLYLIRRFEETVLSEFPKGQFYGTTHTYLGQEANAVGILSAIHEDDIVVSNHRGHGHFLAYGGDPRALFAELMGRSTGVCGGRGGSQHLFWKNFYSNGVLGGTIPLATGMALAEKFKESQAITINFLGDGAFGEGILYEAFNMASLWKAPILYVVENNHIAQSTPIHLNLAGKISSRFESFNIPTIEINTSDVLEIIELAKSLITKTRTQSRPNALILHTHRFGPHSKGDDTRDEKMVSELWNNHDPIEIHGVRLSDKDRLEIENEVNLQINESYLNAIDDPFPSIDIQ